MTTADFAFKLAEVESSPLGRICEFVGCSKPHLAKGYCNLHYRRLRSTGDPGGTKIAPPGSNLEHALRFHGWAVDAEGCWRWAGTLSSYGYGRLNYRGRFVLAHRASYTVFKGEIPDSLLVRHKCDVRDCINPEHLEVGAYRDNYNDMISRGRDRSVAPDRSTFSKLDWDSVDEIRKLRREGATLQEIAERYSVNRSTIGYIVRGDTWVR